MSFAQILENIPWENYAFFICSDIKKRMFHYVSCFLWYGIVPRIYKMWMHSVHCGIINGIQDGPSYIWQLRIILKYVDYIGTHNAIQDLTCIKYTQNYQQLCVPN